MLGSIAEGCVGSVWRWWGFFGSVITHQELLDMGNGTNTHPLWELARSRLRYVS